MTAILLPQSPASAMRMKVGQLPHVDIGPRCLQFPQPLTFTFAQPAIAIDIAKEILAKELDIAQTLYIDNSNNPRAVQVLIGGTQLTETVLPGGQAFLPLAGLPEGSGGLVFTCNMSNGNTGITKLWLLNIPIPATVWDTRGTNGLVNDQSGTQTGSNLNPLPANPARSGLIFQNNGAAVMGLNFNGGANATGSGGSIVVQPNQLIIFQFGGCPLDSVFTVGTNGQLFTLKEIF